MPIDIGQGYQIITRAEWGARAPEGRISIPMPTPRLWVHHTAGSEQGALGMRSIQRYHMGVKGWRDIAYSFVIDNVNGAIYEGRGVGVAGGHTAGDNSKSHAICVMGNFESAVPSGSALSAIVALTRWGRNRRYWVPTLGGHRDASGAQTACPGRNLYRQLPALRLRVADAPDPHPDPEPPEDDMKMLIWTAEENPGPLVITDGIHARRIGHTEADYFVFTGVAHPVLEVPQARIDRLELVGGDPS